MLLASGRASKNPGLLKADAWAKDVRTSRDGWTVFARDRKPSAHYEHTIAVRREKADILSDHTLIEAAIRENPNVQEVELKSITA